LESQSLHESACPTHCTGYGDTVWRTKKYPVLSVHVTNGCVNNKRTNVTLHLKNTLLFLKNVVPGHASCPCGNRDHVTTLFVAKAGTGLLIRWRGYFFVCLTVCTAVLKLAFSVV